MRNNAYFHNLKRVLLMYLLVMIESKKKKNGNIIN